MRKQRARESAPVKRWWQDQAALISIAVIIVMTVIAYRPIFDAQKQFVNWDDDDYITEQPLVQSVDASAIATMFDTDTQVSSNYHPLTMLSLAIDVDRGGMKMRPFMQTNLVLHLCNAVLVFILFYTLLQGNVLVAFTAGLLFAVHPMHVESVAWAAARKDVLYTLWYLASIIVYLAYVRTNRWSLFALSIGMCTLSCLSKPMAVTLPVLLIAVDMYVGRMKGGVVRPLFEKLPMLAISIYFGILTFSIQSSGSVGLVDTTTYGLFERLVFAGHGVLQYLGKFFLPIQLSAFYPYPSELQPGHVPAFMYGGAAVVVLIVIGILAAWRRWRTPSWNLAAFGLAFYFITASLVLQVISVGGASMADRYTYVPYLGLCIIVGVALQQGTARLRPVLIPYLIVAVVGAVMAWGSHERIGVWRNSETLWTDVINQFPYEFTTKDGRDALVKRGALYAYSNRGIHYIKTGQLEKAIADLGVLSRANVIHPDSYRAYGVALQMRSRHPEAIVAFTTAMRQGDLDYQVFRARGASYTLSGNPRAAIQDYEQALRLQPGDRLTTTALNEARALVTRQDPGTVTK